MSRDDRPDLTTVAGVPVAAITTEDLIERVVERAAAGRAESEVICYANAASICLAHDDLEYGRLLREEASMVYADGQAVVWASRFLGQPLPERVNAGDFWPELLRRLAARDLSVYLIGGAAGLAEQAAKRLVGAIPSLKVAGTHRGYFANDAEAQEAARAVRDAAPAVVFVGMGAPYQERWASRHLSEMQAPVVWCVGALFEYYGARRRRAPQWMRRWGLEWAFRLVLEPGRLWRRYLIGNPRFLWLVLKQRFGRKGQNLT